LACFDDASYSWMFSNKNNCVKWKAREIEENYEKQPPKVGTFLLIIFIC
jgi:hypothetical protein